MGCAVCGAPRERGRAHCLICGYGDEHAGEEKWDRAVEAAAYEDLSSRLEPEETLLAATRGRIAGSWRRRMSINPQAMLSPYVNLGITGQRLLIQHVHPNTGRAFAESAGFPLSDVRSITLSDADVLEPGRTVRLVVHLANEEPFRVRVAGRLVKSARGLVDVWRSLAGVRGTSVPDSETCEACGRMLDRPYRFCPFCGSEQGAK